MAGAELHVEYADGSKTEGRVFADEVSVGGISAEQQTFGVADALSSQWEDDPQDGLMGMAYQSIAQLSAPPFFQTVKLSSHIHVEAKLD